MYLLPKRIDPFWERREEIFLKLIKNDYSYSSVLEYKHLREREINALTLKKVDLGKELRGLLAVCSLCGIIRNYKIIAKIKGFGYYSCFIDYIEYYLCEAIFNAAIKAENKKVYVKIKILNNKLKIKISYKGKKLSNLRGGYSCRSIKNIFIINNTEDLIKVKSGTFTEPWFFMCNKLSPVNLALIYG